MKKLIFSILAIGMMAGCNHSDKEAELPKIEVEVHFENGSKDTMLIYSYYLLAKDGRLGTAKNRGEYPLTVARKVVYVKELTK